MNKELTYSEIMQLIHDEVSQIRSPMLRRQKQLELKRKYLEGFAEMMDSLPRIQWEYEPYYEEDGTLLYRPKNNMKHADHRLTLRERMLAKYMQKHMPIEHMAMMMSGDIIEFLMNVAEKMNDWEDDRRREIVRAETRKFEEEHNRMPSFMENYRIHTLARSMAQEQARAEFMPENPTYTPPTFLQNETLPTDDDLPIG